MRTNNKKKLLFLFFLELILGSNTVCLGLFRGPTVLILENIKAFFFSTSCEGNRQGASMLSQSLSYCRERGRWHGHSTRSHNKYYRVRGYRLFQKC